MMYAKLALENVKKSTKDYLIYIVTLTACISMFYAFLSISSNYYDPNIGAEFNLDILGDGIKYAILLITVLLMFLMQYVNHFMIQRRKREFAILYVLFNFLEFAVTLIGWQLSGFFDVLAIDVLAVAMGYISWYFMRLAE